MLMYITNFLFMLILALGIVYLMPPVELMAVLPELSKVTMKSGFFNGLISIFIYLGRPLLWPPALRIIMGLIVTFGTWFLVFFGFMAATVRQSDKGFRVELVTGSKKKPEKRE